MRRAQAVWSLSAAAVIGIGLAVMHAAGAPMPLLVLQAAGGLTALLITLGLARFKPDAGSTGAVLVTGLALAFLAAPLAFVGIDGVQRWIPLGPIQLQPAAIALPVVVWFAAGRGCDRLAAAAMICAAGLCALQPDLQAAVGLAAAAAALVILGRRNVLGFAALATALAACGVAAFGPVLEPVAYVEEVIRRAFLTAWPLGVLAAAGLAVVPWLVWKVGSEARDTALTLAALWLGLCAMSLTEDFPTPVIGYGLSWILGFGVSLGLAATHRR